ncbi:serine/threonine protein kinase [Polyangium jinanense]|uniref:Protein kinase n=1 Tax=Polyangium jinanense TaxID=2829994 RepID=A0A9X4ATR5_9BACT|nr:serine/threonine protein kinase [Polyangium jinanense]MDC3960686.1 protein kinase [Polyangium jinanense]MDC3984518.1 protein kinase [Polyangium jinanense]
MQHAFKPGQILLDKYRVERVLGAGGMGIVVAAWHLALDELVAIKFMLGPGSQADVTRFVREARAAVRLRSQHVARVLDVAALEDGTPYMVLEHLDGNDLSHMLRERGPLPVEEAADAILQACEAIAEAHSIGIVHRDIKPANLFLTRALDGLSCIKVLDFGIAKWANASTAKLDPSQPMGSAPYMAPEQFAATTRVDARTDVWALGATLFHLLTGKMPFHHDDVDSIQSMMRAVLHRPPWKPRELRRDLPEPMEAVLLRCLEKDQAVRFGSVAALAAALAPFGSEHTAMYAKRVAKVLGEPEHSARVPSRPEIAPVAAAPAAPPHAPTAPLGATAQSTEQTAPLPQLGRVNEAATPPAATVTTPQLDASAPSKLRGPLAAALVALVAVLVALAIGIRVGRESVSPAAASDVPEAKVLPPTERPTESSVVAQPPLPAADVSPARDTPARVETTASAPTQRSTSSPPRSARPASLTGAPASKSPPKEDLYGRRR